MSQLPFKNHFMNHTPFPLQTCPTILVANKTDLVRNRQVFVILWLQCRAGQVKGGTGKEVATSYQIKYIETSPGENPPTFSKCDKISSSGINHNVDELLVGLVTQIHLRRREGSSKSSSCKVFIFYQLKQAFSSKLPPLQMIVVSQYQI